MRFISGLINVAAVGVVLVSAGLSRADIVIDGRDAAIYVGGEGPGIPQDGEQVNQSDTGGLFDITRTFTRTGAGDVNVHAAAGMELDAQVIGNQLTVFSSTTVSSAAHGTATENGMASASGNTTLWFTTSGGTYTYDLIGTMFQESGGWAHGSLMGPSGEVFSWGASGAQPAEFTGALPPGQYSLQLQAIADSNGLDFTDSALAGFAKVYLTVHMPEPSSFALLALAARCLMGRRGRREVV